MCQYVQLCTDANIKNNSSSAVAVPFTLRQ